MEVEELLTASKTKAQYPTRGVIRKNNGKLESY